MFGFGGYALYNRAQQLKSKPVIEVTAAQMKKLFIESGLPKDKAEFQVNIQKAIGAGGTCLIGDNMYSLKQRKKPKKKKS